MAEVIRMPRMSDTMTEGKIVAWHKQVGDKVKPGDLMAEVETDKATMELESYQEGTLLHIGVAAGDMVQVEGLIAVIGQAGEDFQSLLSASASATPSANIETTTISPEPVAASTPGVSPEELGVTVIRMPLLSDTMTEGKIVAWNKKVGDVVKSDDHLADVETDKATMEVVPYVEGTLLYIGVEEGKAAKVNDVIAIIGKAGTDIQALLGSLKNETAAPAATKTEASPVASTVAQTTAPEISAATPTTDGRIKASPLARKIAAEKGIALGSIRGSGDGGRIIKNDIENFAPSTGIAQQSAATAVPAFVPGGSEGYVDTPNSQMRKTIARRLSESMYTAPHFFLTMEINMDHAISVRTQYNNIGQVKVSFQDMIIKAAAMSLRQHPSVNSSWMGDFIRTYQHIHIGSAIALPEGLIVPVVRFADQKTLAQIAIDAKALYEKARNKKIQPSEFSGNTFTISNLGMMDIDEFTAIINPPDSCIMAVGRIKETVIKKSDGSFGTTQVMKVTLSCDHRSVDGAVGAAFLQTFKSYMENPVHLLV